MREILHQVITAEPIDDTHVRVSFENGMSGIFDCSPYMKERYWQCLTVPSYFRQVKAEYGTLCWPNDIDVAPEDVWEECIFDSTAADSKPLCAKRRRIIKNPKLAFKISDGDLFADDSATWEANRV